jgi:hypothetical protein
MDMTSALDFLENVAMVLGNVLYALCICGVMLGAVLLLMAVLELLFPIKKGNSKS